MNLTKSQVKSMIQKHLVLIEDTREQKTHISNWFESRKLCTTRWKLDKADYTFMLMPNDILKNSHPFYFGDRLLIERKSGDVNKGGGFQELRNNLIGSDHNRIKAEFEAIKKVDNVYLLIENATGANCIDLVPEYKIPKAQFKKTLVTFLNNRNKERNKPIEVIYCDLKLSGEVVYHLIYEFLIEYFK